jgi:hypothetical protein
MGTGLCTGKRKPPCGKGSNCKGFHEGFRCGGHAPVAGCGGHGTVPKREKKTYLGVPLEQWDPMVQFAVKEGLL